MIWYVLIGAMFLLGIFWLTLWWRKGIWDIKRKKYEDFIDALEDLFKYPREEWEKEIKLSERRELFENLNKAYAKLHIIAPKHIVKLIKDSLNKDFDSDRRNEIYDEFRKDFFGRISFEEEIGFIRDPQEIKRINDKLFPKPANKD